MGYSHDFICIAVTGDPQALGIVGNPDDRGGYVKHGLEFPSCGFASTQAFARAASASLRSVISRKTSTTPVVFSVLSLPYRSTAVIDGYFRAVLFHEDRVVGETDNRALPKDFGDGAFDSRGFVR